MDHQLEQMLMKKAEAHHIPIRMTLELTPVCNMNCKMCYVHEDYAKVKNQLKPLSYWLDLIPALKEAGTMFVTLIGGEPFLYPQIEELYMALVTNGFQVSFTTNGTLLANGLPKWLMTRKPRYVTVSLYGESDDTYKRLTGMADGYTRTIQGIQRLLDSGIPVKINYTMTKANKDDLPGILAIAVSRKLPIVAATYEYPNQSRHVTDALRQNWTERVNPREVAESFWMIQKSLDPTGYQTMLERYAYGPYPMGTALHTDRFTCNAGKSSGWITWKGQLLCCGLIDSPIAEIVEQPESFMTAWQKTVAAVSGTKLSEACVTCPLRTVCDICAAKIKAEGNSFKPRPEYVCEITKEKVLVARDILSASGSNL